MCKLIKVRGKKPGTYAYLHGGYTYSLDKRGRRRIYRCSTKAARKCKGILYRDKKGEIHATKHNHKPEVQVLQKRKLIKTMISMAKKTYLHSKTIFDQVCRSSPTVGKHLSYNQVRSRLERARGKSRPKLPQTLAELHEFLEGYEPVNGFYQGIIESKKCYGLLFSTAKLLATLGKADQLFIDGTFSVVPTVPAIMQLYSIHIRVMDVAIATVFVLTEKRTTGLYKAMWSKLFELVPTLRENVTFIMSDYEKAAMAAAQASFPNSSQHGCWFHYCQALLRRWKKLGLAKCHREILWMGMALPLAPASSFEEGLTLIQLKADAVADEFPVVEMFISYLKRTWVPIAEKVSVHGCPVRTNNVVESFHSTVKGKLGGVHPNLWTFLEKLKELCLDHELNLGRIEENLSVGRSRSEDVRNRDAVIKKNQDDFLTGRISLYAFLSSFSQIHRDTFDQFEDEAIMLSDDEATDETADNRLSEIHPEKNNVANSASARKGLADNGQNPVEQNRPVCCIHCKEVKPIILFIECGHACLCSACSEQYNAQECPSCCKPSARIRMLFS